MPNYTEDDLEHLEESAEMARPGHQAQALALVAGVLERNAIAYGVMGGMNFYLRGSGRTTGDVDIAVDNPPRMEALLSIFNSHRSTRLTFKVDLGMLMDAIRESMPAVCAKIGDEMDGDSSEMQWVSGVARIVVDIRGQLVQLDLKPKGSEGHLIPRDIASSVERMSFTVTQISFQCDMLAIGPLVAAKLKSHYNRETRADYQDLVFIVSSSRYAPQVRQASGSYRSEWTDFFLETALQNDAHLEQSIRWAFNMPRSRSNSGR
ncbi:uncharacterized protein VDAG_04726 [Verticillium dahliae VdLs.17]|uniref:Uncharacterized protein n=1 Tax=Verticillium dahliae (strain VdLs.17 / ATCC MYA-4575 / FGSC 10137) TaxID=498257 RepID=G2X3Y9_VERDV|nr:uncharacterized protein VDAG_04726 [Verticillium dahliae VdLs.17]EGY23288.1 hypothetical protein VDAG_04726 [Verticillium dahliae VdLs.17]KAH6691877.1 hypothetical protein EV126DRAFT_347203 [Verticillium dahliae]